MTKSAKALRATTTAQATSVRTSKTTRSTKSARPAKRAGTAATSSARTTTASPVKPAKNVKVKKPVRGKALSKSAPATAKRASASTGTKTNDTSKKAVAAETVRRPRGRPSTREAMLDAAESVVLENGASRLTLDAVARQAGASKGGILYNFPSKQALLKGMVERLVDQNRKAHATTLDALPDSPTRALRAYVMNSVRTPDTDDHLSGALLAALAAEPSLLKPVADYFSSRFGKISQQLPLEHAAIVHLATEGLWILELLQISPFSSRQRTRIVERLLTLAEQGLPE